MHHFGLQVRFERGTIATPELLQDIELPSSVSVLGQPIDLTNLKVTYPICKAITITLHKHMFDRSIL